MEAGTVVAIYAAVVATGSVGWQVFMFHRTRATRVKVYARIAIAAPADDVVHFVAVNVLNKSEHPINVSGVGVELQDGSGRELHIFQQLLDASIPGSIAPRDSGHAYIEVEGIEQAGIDLMKPLTAWARLSTDERFTGTATLMRS